ncbi:MAG: hypothetical protein ACJAWV_001167, partial [Flammeovirgaceae bacterium]
GFRFIVQQVVFKIHIELKPAVEMASKFRVSCLRKAKVLSGDRTF